MDRNKKIYVAPEDTVPVVTVANYISVASNGWPRHSVVDPELVLVVQGEFTAEDPDHALTPLGAGDVLFIRPNHPCDLLRKDSSAAVISCIHFELIDGLHYQNGDYEITPVEPWVIATRGNWSMIELFRRSAAEFTGYSPFRRELLGTMLREIWLRLMAIEMTSGREKKRVNPGRRMEEMLSFLRGRLKKGVTRHELAREFSLTPEHVNYLFRRELGLTPTAFLNRERCLRGAQLLAEGRQNVSQVALEVGFQDPLYFSRTFKKMMGFPPGQLL